MARLERSSTQRRPRPRPHHGFSQRARRNSYQTHRRRRPEAGLPRLRQQSAQFPWADQDLAGLLFRLALSNRCFNWSLNLRRPEFRITCRKFFRYVRLFGADGVKVALRVNVRLARDLLHAFGGVAFCFAQPVSPVQQIVVLRQSFHRHKRKKGWRGDRKSTRLNSSHTVISYAVFCLKKKKKKNTYNK